MGETTRQIARTLWEFSVGVSKGGGGGGCCQVNPLNTHILPLTHPLNTPCQYTLPPSQLTLSPPVNTQHPHYTSCQHILLIYALAYPFLIVTSCIVVVVVMVVVVVVYDVKHI